MHRTKVLVIAGWYPTTHSPVTGIFVREHVRAAAVCHDVAVIHSLGISRSLMQVYRVIETSEEGIKSFGIEYRKSPVPKTSYLMYLLGVMSVLRRLRKEGFHPDLIHAHVYSAGFTAALISAATGIPVVVSEHYSGFALGHVRGVERIKAKVAFNRARVVCPVSDDLGRWIRALGFRGELRTVPNVVDTTIFHPSRSSIPSPRGRAKRLLLVALLDPKKGIPSLLHALTILRQGREEIRLDIIGDGPRRAEYEDLVDRLNLRGVVTFHGIRDKSEVAGYMQAADLLVLPSPYETFGVVLIESLACGKPVVAVAAGGPLEIVTKEVGQLAVSSTPEDLANAIQYVLQRLDDYPSARLAAYAQERFGLESVAVQLRDVYRSALLPRGERRRR